MYLFFITIYKWALDVYSHLKHSIECWGTFPSQPAGKLSFLAWILESCYIEPNLNWNCTFTYDKKNLKNLIVFQGFFYGHRNALYSIFNFACFFVKWMYAIFWSYNSNLVQFNKIENLIWLCGNMVFYISTILPNCSLVWCFSPVWKN